MKKCYNYNRGDQIVARNINDEVVYCGEIKDVYLEISGRLLITVSLYLESNVIPTFFWSIKGGKWKYTKLSLDSQDWIEVIIKRV